MKKSLVVLLAVVIFGGGVAAASSVLKWGGEEDIQEIYVAVDSLDNQLSLKKEDLKAAELAAGNTKIDLETAKSEHKLAMEQIAEINEKLLEKANEIANLQTELQTAKKTIDERDQIIVEKVAKIAKQVELLAQYAEQNKQTTAMAQERIDLLEGTIAELELDYNTKAEQVKKLSGQLTELTTQKNQLQSEYDSLKVNHDDTQAKLDAALSDVETLKDYVNQKVNDQQ